MSRRLFLQSLTTLLGGLALPAMAQTKPDSPCKPLEADWKILQISPVAGFQFYQGEALWPQLATGQPIMLIRKTGYSLAARICVKLRLDRLSSGWSMVYPSHFKIRRLYLLPLGEGRMRDYKNRILKCDEYSTFGKLPEQ